MTSMFRGLQFGRCVFFATGLIFITGGIARAELLDVVELPKLTDNDPIELGNLPEADASTAAVNLLNATSQMATMPAAQNAYKCEKGNDGWTVTSNKSFGSPLATFRFDKGRLVFQWASGAPPAVANGLRNTLVKVEYGKDTIKTIALRKPVRAAAKPLDFNRETDVFTPEVNDLPDGDKYFLEVTALNGYDQTVTFNPNNGMAGLKQPVNVMFQPVPTISISIQLRCTLSKLGQTLQLEVHHGAVSGGPGGMGGLARPFTVRSVNTAMMQTKNIVTNARSRLAKDEQLYAQLEQKLANMNTAANRNVKQQAAYNAQIGKLQQQLTTDKQRITQLQTALPAMENQLAALPVLAKVAGDLDGKGMIEYRILYQVEKKYIVLFATENASIVPPAESTY